MAKEKNADISDDVRNALEDNAETSMIDEVIETTSYYLSEQTKWDKDKKEYVVTGYLLSNVLKITTSDIDKAGEIIDVAVDTGATSINNVQFTLSDDMEDALKGDVLTQAAERARKKAENIVYALNAKLGKIVSISESSYYNGPYRLYGDNIMKAYAEESAEIAETSISPQELTITGTVTLIYEIE